ncbi:MAG: sugar transporter [Methylocystis sp.]|nr:MAG: sugar transporter [Methylocystis sp.]
MILGSIVLGKRRFASFFFAACCLLLSGCSSTEMGVGGDLPEADSVRAKPAVVQSDYRLSPQDILEVNVYQFPNLSRTVQVDGAGRASLPLIGAVTAGGKTVTEFQNEVTRLLGARYLQSPQVSVFLKESVGLRVTVDGAVKKPGVYMLKGRTTLVQALAMADGINDIGDSVVTVSRTSDGRQVQARYDVAAIRAGQANDPIIYGGDFITVNESVARQGLSVVKNAVPAAVAVGARPW